MNDTNVIEALRLQNTELRSKVAEQAVEIADLVELNKVAVDNALDAERATDDALQTRRLAECLRDTLNVYLGEADMV